MFCILSFCHAALASIRLSAVFSRADEYPLRFPFGTSISSLTEPRVIRLRALSYPHDSIGNRVTQRCSPNYINIRQEDRRVNSVDWTFLRKVTLDINARSRMSCKLIRLIQCDKQFNDPLDGGFCDRKIWRVRTAKVPNDDATNGKGYHKILVLYPAASRILPTLSRMCICGTPTSGIYDKLFLFTKIFTDIHDEKSVRHSLAYDWQYKITH